MSVELSLLVPHFPSICHEEQTPDYQMNMVNALKDVSKRIASLKPDVIVLVSCHWPSTFNHYVDCTPVHKGVLTAVECPDIVSDVNYHYPGDADLANKLVEAGKSDGLQVTGISDPYYMWDYGSVVPLRYLVPNEDIPVVNLSVTLAANLKETRKWGQQIAKVLKETDKRVVFVSSGALSHNLVRGRENTPTAVEHAMDRQFIDFVMEKNYHAAYEMLPQYASAAKVESGGRHLAMLFGIIEKDSKPENLAEGQSSGSWNAVMTFE